jgi:SAM-dependent methyltransferase
MDVADLREFYGTRLGLATRRLMARRLRDHWPSGARGTFMGLGYAAPYMDALAKGADRALAFMPAQRGVIQWPADGPVSAALVDEFELPLVESAVDQALVVHGLELTDDPAEMLREVWRVLSPQGRLLLAVPNRRGMWARFDSTPFGYGQPFSRPQLARLLKETQFSPTGWTHALFMPPFERGLVLKSAAAIERMGGFASPAFSGVVIVEAVKQVYAVPRGKRVRRLLPRLKPALAPGMNPSYEGRPFAQRPFSR